MRDYARAPRLAARAESRNPSHTSQLYSLFSMDQGLKYFQNGRLNVVLNMLARDKDQVNILESAVFVSKVLQTIAFHDWSKDSFG